jgi:hypothetical protein
MEDFSQLTFLILQSAAHLSFGPENRTAYPKEHADNTSDIAKIVD